MALSSAFESHQQSKEALSRFSIESIDREDQFLTELIGYDEWGIC
jgi:hypothetical protein